MEKNILQKIPNRIAGDCVAVRIRILNRVITSIYDESLRPFGIRSSQMNILVAISAFGATTANRLCKILYLDPSTLSRNVERMKKKGWLETVPSTDGRSRMIQTASEGLKILARAYPAWENAQANAQQLLGPATIEAVAATANKLLLKGMAQS